MKTLKIADGLSLPIDAVTQTIAILARKRSGKSYLMRRIMEQLFKAHQQIVICDPKGDWHGIRSSADGKHPGLPVVIFGGEHADVPLDPHSGELVATLLAQEGISALLDMGHMRKHELRTFMTAFMETLYRLKAQEKYRTPMMLGIDEADMIAPQKPQQDEARMLGALDDIVRRGGQRGIGCLFATQRSAVVNKNILSQLQILVALRTIAPQDLKAMDAWIENHGTPEQRDILMKSLPSLPIGTAWFWSPGWPDDEGIFKCAQVLPIETFDSGATPTAGKKIKAPKTVADIDLSAVRRQMAETLDRAKADDPKALRAEIADLKKELAKQPAIAVKKTAEVPIVRPAELKRIERLFEKCERARDNLATVQKNFTTAVNALQSSLLAVIAHEKKLNNVSLGKQDAKKLNGSTPRRLAPLPDMTGELLPKGERMILIAIAQHAQGVNRQQLTVLTGFKKSTRDAYLARLVAKGFVVINDNITATQAGRDALGADYHPLPTGDKLREYWLTKLPEGERKVLAAVTLVFPESVSRDAITETTEYKKSTRDAYIHRLETKKLVTVEGRGEIRASQELFG